MSKPKRCSRCKKEKPREDFVNIYGYTNPRGKYCEKCFHDREQERVCELMDGRDFCLYCGKKISRYCDFSPEGRSIKTYINWDHMDPRAGGGHDEYGVVDLDTGEISEDDRNLVYCCTDCNLKKRDMPFVEWLAMLEPKYQELARAVYAEKHGGLSPEEFVPKEDVVIEIRLDVDGELE